MNFRPSPFKPAWWLNHPHLQTIWPELMRKRIKLREHHERFELKCGDFVDLAWSQTGFDETVLLLHGLAGGISSPYIRGMIKRLNSLNYNTVVMHFRGCSKEFNRHPEFFHGGQTSDLIEVIRSLKNSVSNKPLYAIGFSIGGNILLKYLGEEREASMLNGAAAISIPFLLAKTQEQLSQGFSRVYQRYLLNRLITATIKKFIMQGRRDVDLFSIVMAKNIRQFDELVTVPLHGFENSDDYYAQASSFHYLKHIKTPTLIIHAKDDPFLPISAIPKKIEASEQVHLLLPDNGGHVGFVCGKSPRQPEYWLEDVVPKYFLHLRQNLS